MKSFKEYIELKEERELEIEMLNEDPLMIASTILGYSIASLAIGWGGALVVSSYLKLAGKIITGIRRVLRRKTGEDKSSREIEKGIRELRTDINVRREKNKQDSDYSKYSNDMKEVFDAISEKDVNLTKEKIKEVKINPEVINKLVIMEVTKVFEEPPLHYGTTGNDAYLFIKKVLGMKIAKAVSIIVSKALSTKGIELIQDNIQL